VTERERFDREALLKRAVAVAGAVYLAPVLTSAASAGSDGCIAMVCSKKKRKWKRKHRKKCQNSCPACHCDCPAPGTHCAGNGFLCGCQHQGPQCGYVEPCQTGNCACFFNGNGQNPGACIDLLDGLCDTFEAIGTCPGGSDAECPSGARCFSSCCEDLGYPHLCGPCCPGTPGAFASPSRGSAAVAWF
jgi:hypothetical protein